MPSGKVCCKARLRDTETTRMKTLETFNRKWICFKMSPCSLLPRADKKGDETKGGKKRDEAKALTGNAND